MGPRTQSRKKIQALIVWWFLLLLLRKLRGHEPPCPHPCLNDKSQNMRIWSLAFDWHYCPAFPCHPLLSLRRPCCSMKTVGPGFWAWGRHCHFQMTNPPCLLSEIKGLDCCDDLVSSTGDNTHRRHRPRRLDINPGAATFSNLATKERQLFDRIPL